MPLDFGLVMLGCCRQSNADEEDEDGVLFSLSRHREHDSCLWMMGVMAWLPLSLVVSWTAAVLGGGGRSSLVSSFVILNTVRSKQPRFPTDPLLVTWRRNATMVLQFIIDDERM